MKLLLILAILLLLGYVLEIYFKKNWSKGLKVRVSFLNKEALIGEKVLINEELYNRNKIFMPYIEMKYEILKNDNHFQNQKGIFSLVDHQKVTRTVEFPC